MPLVLAWVIGFALQGQIRARIFDTPALVPLMPMTSAAFIVFTLYMIPDPATTPLKPWRQVLFGFSVAMVYGIIQVLHLVFGLFFALLAVCAIRGLSLHVYYTLKSPGESQAEPLPKAPRFASPAYGTAPSR
jgi:Na+-translocating ferredoxin:NAD+ oxidoreductase RnfD subunit